MTGSRLVLCLLLVVAVCSHANAAPVSLVVQLSPTASISTVLSALGATSVDSIQGGNAYLINVDSTQVAAASQTVAIQGAALGIIDFHVNARMSLLSQHLYGVVTPKQKTPADWFKNQPAMLLTNAQSALKYASGKGVVIADINSIVDYSHPALKGHLTSGYDFILSKPASQTSLDQSGSDFLDQSGSDFLDQSGSDFLDQSGSDFLDQNGAKFVIPPTTNVAYAHGTLVAGILAVSAPAAMIMPLRAFDDNGQSDEFILAKAIRYAADHGAQVINMSFGSLVDSGVVRGACNYASAKGAILVSSAGNNSTSAPQYPAAYNSVTAVSATNILDIKAAFSNYGSYVGIDGPGVNIVSAYPGSLYAVVSGTSFSSPMVAATAALVQSMKMSSVLSDVESTSVNIDAQNPGYINQLGSGRLNVLKAVHP